MTSTTRSASLFWAAFLTVALSLSGCSQPPSSAPPASVQGGSTGPEFAGPWADEFGSVFRRATTEFERTALADGRISDAEFAEMENRFTTCLTERNVTFGGFKPGGGYEFRPGAGVSSEKANTIADDCSASSGLNTIGYLYFAMQRNPQNLDEARLMAACLVEKKAVPAGYSAADYDRDSPDMTYPFISDSAGDHALDECSADPLGILGTGDE
ncbi:hypothetical protein LLS1_16030 [Leifsonia sp. LS1]|uniref:hypothetical protein n=1 Tax=Leifsonia sp. LS1 TaxID=2828483 RepID=UPI001CFD4539|nr:hypothetical protein [Leifsonia sp. LS1]GIT79934.1 hypothetical protein LLS1_16030 [Leifsonia sp. LS1]